MMTIEDELSTWHSDCELCRDASVAGERYEDAQIDNNNNNNTKNNHVWHEFNGSFEFTRSDFRSNRSVDAS